ncbi:hypothetical protein DPEC_G00345420 [Dallia pectoralis]|uniref:Uncharacterized protein n=1 Tax=Dallia pectoralis TaxID=75939 RepID=A0ACC2F3H5_DALPE|nr:hypothetical protein DPEC_G00345420 [Dallia pectoralis]
MRVKLTHLDYEEATWNKEQSAAELFMKSKEPLVLGEMEALAIPVASLISEYPRASVVEAPVPICYLCLLLQKLGIPALKSVNNSRTDGDRSSTDSDTSSRQSRVTEFRFQPELTNHLASLNASAFESAVAGV